MLHDLRIYLLFVVFILDVLCLIRENNRLLSFCFLGLVLFQT
ncbi:hypothetical protein DsansV1_C03g0025611 [Dioscorea sansibarensis]